MDGYLASDSVVWLERWIEHPDASLEFLEKPLTPEEFLDPRLGDRWLQGRLHSETLVYLTDAVRCHFYMQPDVLVAMNLKHCFDPELPGPAPDIAVLRGVSDPDQIEDYFDFQKIGALPCLLIEVLSTMDRRIRRVDEEDKVDLYQKVGISEYLLVLPPRYRRPDQRFGLRGYRLGPNRLYQPIEPDEKERLLSSTTGLQFAVSPEGDRIDVFNAATGERYRTFTEEKKVRQAAESALQAADAARKAAEEELERLRAEIQRLKPGP